MIGEEDAMAAMGQMGQMPSGQTMAGPSPMTTTQTVPVAALAIPGEDEKLVNPEPGDKVQFNVDALVKSVDGETATVEIVAINGEEVKELGTGTDGVSPEPYEDLKADADKMGVL